MRQIRDQRCADSGLSFGEALRLVKASGGSDSAGTASPSRQTCMTSGPRSEENEDQDRKIPMQ